MVQDHQNIGIIAGGGKFPLLLADALKNKGLSVIAVALHGETDSSLSQLVGKTLWVELGQLDALIQHFKQNRVTKAIMAGTINKRRMFDNPLPDQTAKEIVSNLAAFHDDGILRAFSDLLREKGIEIISAGGFLPELTAKTGYLTLRRLNEEEEADVEFGWKMAKAIGHLDIGQCVVVRKRTVLAVEAIEGTDKSILRGGGLAREKAVVVKVCKPNQDLRFDMPSIGLETVKVMSRVKAAVLAVEAGRTLIFDRAEMIKLADESGISIIAVNEGGKL